GGRASCWTMAHARSAGAAVTGQDPTGAVAPSAKPDAAGQAQSALDPGGGVTVVEQSVTATEPLPTPRFRSALALPAGATVVFHSDVQPATELFQPSPRLPALPGSELQIWVFIACPHGGDSVAVGSTHPP